MKKTTIYLLSIIIIAVVAASVLGPAYQMVKFGASGFEAGFEAGVKADNTDADFPEIGEPVNVKFTPEVSTLMNPRDSIIFDNGSKLPLVIDQVAVILPAERIPSWYTFTTIICYPLQIVLLALLIWRFIKFIINISREKIFVRQNVKLLRQFSFLLLTIALLEILGNIANGCLFNSFHFEMEGYELSAFSTIPWGNLLLGLIGLLMAQVWSRGIEIREEHELTI